MANNNSKNVGGVSRLLQGSYKLRLLQVGVVDENDCFQRFFCWNK